jgi:hypothetical protein
MCSSTLIAQTAVTRSSLIPVASSEICSREKEEAEFHPLHMGWVLIADGKGDPRPSVHWLVD